MFKSKKINDLSNFRKCSGSIIYMNDHVNLIYEASKSCYGSKNLAQNDTEKLRYIARRVNEGHESILEHSNIVMKINFVLKTDVAKNIAIAGQNMKYLRYFISQSANRPDSYYMIISGSIRAYKNMIRDAKYDDLFTPIYRIVLNNLYGLNKEYFIDFISNGLMTDSSFNLIEPSRPIQAPGKRVSILNMDDLNVIKNIIYQEEGVYPDLYDLINIGSVSVLFMNLSRAATHQLVRHRNAITQESQRYTSCKNAAVTNPADYKDKYNKYKRYHINCLNNDFTFEELGKVLTSIYSDLVDQGVDKEDARGYLPINTQCTRLYMTFTYRSLFKFFELRCDKAAQAEIRASALELEDLISDFLHKLYIPVYSNFLVNRSAYSMNDYSHDYNNIDEAIGDVEESIEELNEE